MFLAQDMGWLDPKEIELVSTATSTESIKAIASGRLDGAALTLDEVLRARSQGLPLQVVLIFDISVGADALLATPAIHSLDELRGKRIAMEFNATSEILLSKALEKSHLKKSDITLIPIEGEHAMTWKNQHPDAIVTYEPTVSKLESEGAIRLFDSRETPNMIIDVLAVLSDALSGEHQALETLISGHLQGLRHWRTNQIDTSYRLARALRTNGDDVAKLFQHLQLPDIDYNRHLLSSPSEELTRSAREIIDLLNIPLPKTPPERTPPLFLADYLPESLP